MWNATPDPFGCGSFRSSLGQGLDWEKAKNVGLLMAYTWLVFGACNKKALLVPLVCTVHLLTREGNKLTDPAVACNLGGLYTAFK